MILPDIPTALSEAAQRLASIEQMICNFDGDDDSDLDSYLRSQFNNALDDVAKAVDQQKALRSAVIDKLAAIELYIEKATELKQRLERLNNKIRAATKAVVEANPNIEFRDSFGKKLSVVRTIVPRLIVEEWVGIHDLTDLGFTRTQIKIDESKIKDALLDGKKFPWARLEYTTYLRGL